jgi:hypothetical protein
VLRIVQLSASGIFGQPDFPPASAAWLCLNPQNGCFQAVFSVTNESAVFFELSFSENTAA